MKCKLSFKFCNPKNNNNFLAHLANAKLILIHLQLLKIIWFINQIMIIFNQWRFNFYKVCQIFMSRTIQTRIIMPILCHCDDLVWIVHLQPTTSQSYQHTNKIEHTFSFNLWFQNSQYFFGKETNIWWLSFMNPSPS